MRGEEKMEEVGVRGEREEVGVRGKGGGGGCERERWRRWV